MLYLIRDSQIMTHTWPPSASPSPYIYTYSSATQGPFSSSIYRVIAETTKNIAVVWTFIETELHLYTRGLCSNHHSFRSRDLESSYPRVCQEQNVVGGASEALRQAPWLGAKHVLRSLVIYVFYRIQGFEGIRGQFEYQSSYLKRFE